VLLVLRKIDNFLDSGYYLYGIVLDVGLCWWFVYV
jgi:hypothetical protein